MTKSPFYLIEYRSGSSCPMITRYETESYAMIAYRSSKLVKFLVHENDLPKSFKSFNIKSPSHA